MLHFDVVIVSVSGKREEKEGILHFRPAPLSLETGWLAMATERTANTQFVQYVVFFIASFMRLSRFRARRSPT